MTPSPHAAAGPARRCAMPAYRPIGRHLPTVLGAALIGAAALAGTVAPAAAQTPARDLFGQAATPAPLAARAIGSYAKGCLAGAVPLAVDGPTWQVMRLSRNRNWGHPDLIRLLERLSADARADGWNGLLVGDLAQPRGGPMTSGHSSHQIGLDADIWLTPMPNRTLSRTEREEMSAVSMLKPDSRYVDPALFTPAHAGVIRRAAKYPETARIFVHPGIKKALCESAGSDRAWLRKVRPWWGHHYHFHIRIACPAGSVGCSDQDAPPPGDGCGSELDWWLSDEPWVPKPGAPPPAPAKPLTMADLPGECRVVLEAGAMPVAAREVPMPRPRP
jgi:penicillin-insensitive murein endopeptidase